MEIVFWIVIVFLLTYEPIFGFYHFQKFKQNMKRSESAKIKYYKDVMVGLWVPALFILALAVCTDLSLKQMGISIPAIHTGTLGSFASYIFLGLGFLYFVLVLYCIIGYWCSKKVKHDLSKKKAEEMKKSDIGDILPITLKEKRMWNYVSLTAGITEELIYRGFSLFALPALFPSLSIWIVVLAASLIFGLAHTYQGVWQGVVRTSCFGFLFCLLSIILGSIIPLIVLHFLVDYIGKLGDENVIKA
ncbi:CPBP family intramembrane glutamic endopeptidase [Bacillus mojavensis]|uniref:CPBP family intramembrane glutamic endopeptidase n=1 Tax=Bacillus mojavensis TaxID=72360 RepID=UPI002DB5A3E1|nr:CPBP family intramembrane glutamic endopeptidase [Bacillus mojavensis]MEC1682614.1 CPBP family intramembrane metalloprotease [Bacillus mojavensis]MEC1709446.1 CPBP family intramembrane metalloprotease [Bacillus mojavensis]